MKGTFKKNRWGKHLFRNVYCACCKSKKTCGKLDKQKKYCCACYGQEILAELEKDGLLINSAQQALNNYRLGVIACQCLGVEKPRLEYISSDGSGWTKCKGCDKTIASAGHHGVIKNRNNPSFWGLECKEKVLCGECLGKLVEKMPTNKKYTFNKYLKRGYWK